MTTSKTKQFCKTSSIFPLDNVKKTKQFCETSSFSEVDNIKNERILRDLLQKWKVECRADCLVPMRFCLPRKSDARSYEVLHLSRKIISAKLQNATPLRKSAPWPPNISDEHVSCSAPATENASLQVLFECPTPAIVFVKATQKPIPFSSFLARCTIPCACHVKRDLNVKKWSGPGVFCTFWLWHVLRATTACTFSTSQLPKVVRSWCALYILTSKCARCHNGVHFFDIATSKSGPDLVCFVPLFRHRNFQKWSEAGVFCTFWLRHVHAATTACTFSTAQLLHVLWSWSVLYILTWKCASRRNGVQFFISHLASWLRARRFSEPTFRPSGATNHCKTQCFAIFLPFRTPGSSFFWPLSLLWSSLSTLLFSPTLPVSAFHLSILSEVWLLNFLLFSNIYIYYIYIYKLIHIFSIVHYIYTYIYISNSILFIYIVYIIYFLYYMYSILYI